MDRWSKTIRRLGTALASTAALWLAASCATTAPSQFVEGEFQLEAISGNPLPATLSGALVIVSESLTLHPGGGMVSEQVFRNLTQGDPDTEVREHRTGTWSRNDSLVTLVWGPSESMTLRIEEDGATLRSVAETSSGPGLDILRVYIYRRGR